jgi:hypothetical protein
MRMGRPRGFDTSDHDYALAVSVDGSEDTIVRLMHCEPVVEEGSFVALGDQIGKALRSRYFNYWTGPHYHVEVMGESDVYRSTKSISLDVDLGTAKKVQSEKDAELEAEVLRVSKDNALLSAPGLDLAELGPYKGIHAETSKSRLPGILDAGVTHYPHGAVVGSGKTVLSEGITFQSHRVGDLLWSRGSLHYYLRTALLSFDLNGNALRGLSCYLYPREYLTNGTPPLLAIPPEYGGFIGQLEEGSVYQFNINTVKESQA